MPFDVLLYLKRKGNNSSIKSFVGVDTPVISAA
jgi:hypothetical protein